MKKRSFLICIIILILSFMPALSYAADNAFEDIPITVMLNSKKLDFDVSPQIIKGSTYVPLRAIFEALGATLSWDPETNTITCVKNNTKIVLPIGQKIVELNGKKAILEAPALLIQGRTLVPVRFIAESLGCTVGWNSLTRTVSIMYNTGFPPPPPSPLPSTFPPPPPPPPRANLTLSIDKTKEWRSTNTEHYRLYFYQDEEIILSKIDKITSIYNKICEYFGHKISTSSFENALIPIYFLDDECYLKYLGNSPTVAVWSTRDNAMIVNMDKSNTNDILFSAILNHEFIHAITLSSTDSKIKKIPKWFIEGIACYYEADFIIDNLSLVSIKKDRLLNVKKIAREQPISWDSLEKGFSSSDLKVLTLSYTVCPAIFDYLLNTYGEDKIINIFYTEGDFYEVLQKVTSMSLSELEADWLRYLASQ